LAQARVNRIKHMASCSPASSMSMRASSGAWSNQVASASPASRDRRTPNSECSFGAGLDGDVSSVPMHRQQPAQREQLDAYTDYGTELSGGEVGADLGASTQQQQMSTPPAVQVILEKLEQMERCGFQDARSPEEREAMQARVSQMRQMVAQMSEDYNRRMMAAQNKQESMKMKINGLGRRLGSIEGAPSPAVAKLAQSANVVSMRTAQNGQSLEPALAAQNQTPEPRQQQSFFATEDVAWDASQFDCLRETNVSTPNRDTTRDLPMCTPSPDWVDQSRPGSLLFRRCSP